MDIKDVEKLIQLFQGSDITKVRWTQGDNHLLLEKNSRVEVLTQQEVVLAPRNLPSNGTAETARPAAKIEENKENLYFVEAPLVGTFYRSASPDKPPFIKVGDKVKKGTTLCIIEAMKLMNEIESEVSGEVVSILVENAHSVEFGTKIFGIRPD